MSLPPELQDLVSRTVVASGLKGAQRERVERDLEAHFHDGQEAGIPVSVLAREFGDPRLTASAIRRASSSWRRRAAKVLLPPVTAAALCYGVAVGRVHSAPDVPESADLVALADFALARAERAQRELTDTAGIHRAFQVATTLWSRGDFWSEAASLRLLRETVAAADSLLPAWERGWLADSLRSMVEPNGDGLAVRRSAMESARATLISHIYGSDGRVGAYGRRLIVRTKGRRALGPRALLAEPLYFALPLSRARVEELVDGILEERAAHARVALRLGNQEQNTSDGPPVP